MLYRFTKDNDGSTWDAGANYSVTPGYFQVVPPAAGALILREFIIEITSTTAFDETKFGDISAIANGIKLEIVSVKAANEFEPLKNLLGSSTIKKNSDLLALGFQFTALSTKSIQGRLALPALQVNGPKQLILATVSDDLSGVTITTVRMSLQADTVDNV